MVPLTLDRFQFFRSHEAAIVVYPRPGGTVTMPEKASRPAGGFRFFSKTRKEQHRSPQAINTGKR